MKKNIVILIKKDKLSEIPLIVIEFQSIGLNLVV